MVNGLSAELHESECVEQRGSTGNMLIVSYFEGCLVLVP